MEEEIQKLIQEAVNENNFGKIQENGLFLSNKQIQILERNNIPWKRYASLKELLFYIEDILYEEENEELDRLAEQLAEQQYYQNTNK